jgi:hypothetical protein
MRKAAVEMARHEKPLSLGIVMGKTAVKFWHTRIVRWSLENSHLGKTTAPRRVSALQTRVSAPHLSH